MQTAEKVNVSKTLKGTPFSRKTLKRMSQLTEIPLEKLTPIAFVHPSFYHGAYTSKLNTIKLKERLGTNQSFDILEHETLHAIQKYLGHNLQLYRYFKYGELGASFATHLKNYPFQAGLGGTANLALSLLSMELFPNSPKTTAVFSTMATASFAQTLLDCRRIYTFKRAVDRHGVDGWIALHALGSFEPLFSQGYLKVLEKKGYLHSPEKTDGKKGFTKKGEEWIKTFTPKITAFLESAEKERKKQGLKI